MDGYIKFYRKTLDSPIICKDSDYFAVWGYLLLSATHKEYETLFNGEKIILLPGQLITGRKAISSKFKVDESKVQRILKSFENEHQIEQLTCNRNRLITILNWDIYQSNEQQIKQQVNNNCTTSEQPVNTNKKVKNIKNVKNKTYGDFFEEIWKLYPIKKGKASVSDKQKNILFKIGYEEIERAIKRYIDDSKNTNIEFWKYGSSFFNKGYIDYLDENYTPVDPNMVTIKKESAKPKNSFTGFGQRTYDYNELEKQLLK